MKKIFLTMATALVFFGCAQIDETERGVVLQFGKYNETFEPGLNFYNIFTKEVVRIPVCTQLEAIKIESGSKDLQTVTTTLAINYRVDTGKSFSIYKNIGASYEEILVVPAVNEVLKAITAQYTAEESVTNRALISDGLVAGLNEKLNNIGLYITDVNIINFDFSEAYINAIEEKQVAQQKLLKAETEKQTAITNAQAEAEATKIRAEAEAEANRLISESLTDEVIENKKIEKWNGELPRVTGAGGTMLDMSSVIGDSETTGGYDNEYYGE
jgi:regulator of protease activity HflC (stomatin/prohibitin superfamily)